MEREPENLEPNDSEPDDVPDTEIYDEIQLEEIKGELPQDTLKRARDLIGPIESKIQGINEEKKMLEAIKAEIEEEAKRQISNNKKFRESKNP